MDHRDQEILLPYLKTGIALLAFICIAILIYALSVAGSLLIPFVIALFIYILLQPLIGLLTRKRLPHILVTVLTMVITMVVVLGVSQVVYQSVSTFAGGLPRYEERFTDIWGRIAALFGFPADAFAGGWSVTSDPRFAEFFQDFSVTDAVGALLTAANTLVSNLVLVFLFLLFILLGRDSVPRKIRSAFSPSVSATLGVMIVGIRDNTQKYIVIKTLVSAVVAGLVMLITLLFGLDFVVVWGLLTFVLNFIPNLGSIVASLLPFLFGLVQFENPMTAVWMGVAIVGVQFAVGNVLEPSLMGRSIRLSPLLILFSLIFWGSIWGIVGMFLSVPLTAIIKIVFDNVKPLRTVGIMMGGPADDVAVPGK